MQLSARGFTVDLFEMRPAVGTAVHKTGLCAELVCSNSLKSLKAESAAGMLKQELSALGSYVYDAALACRVPAGGALAVDRDAFAARCTDAVEAASGIRVVRQQVSSVEELGKDYDAVIVASGPLTSDNLAQDLIRLTGSRQMAFFDAAAPIVMADSLDMSVLFTQSRYEAARDVNGNVQGDYLNAPFTRQEYDAFIEALLDADRVVARDFETKDLFQACQPIEEIARKGHDAPRFGAMKPVGLTDPRTGRRPWAALQLRAENTQATSYNLVGFQTNLKFAEQQRVFRMIPGLQHAEFARYGVMHRNTFVDAPHVLDETLRMRASSENHPVFMAGQVSGTEGYCEAIRSGLHAALSAAAYLEGKPVVALPPQTAFGALMAYATSPESVNYQPMHVNFGIMPPLDMPIKNKAQRYAAFARRGADALSEYRSRLVDAGLLAE